MAKPKSVQLMRSSKATLHHQYHWFVVPSDDHMPIFSAPQSGDAGLKACLTWLKNQGYRKTDEIGEIFKLDEIAE